MRTAEPNTDMEPLPKPNRGGLAPYDVDERPVPGRFGHTWGSKKARVARRRATAGSRLPDEAAPRALRGVVCCGTRRARHRQRNCGLASQDRHHLALLGAFYAQLKRRCLVPRQRQSGGFPPAAPIPVSNGRKILPPHDPRISILPETAFKALPTFPNIMERIGWRSANPDKGTDPDCQHCG